MNYPRMTISTPGSMSPRRRRVFIIAAVFIVAAIAFALASANLAFAGDQQAGITNWWYSVRYYLPFSDEGVRMSC